MTECYGDYNEELLDPLQPLMGYILRALTVIGIILCALCYKWRHLADYCFIAEMLTRAVAVFHLNSTNYLGDENNVLLLFSTNYLLYAVGYRYEIIIASLNLGFNLIVGINVVYARPLIQDTLRMYIVYFFMSMLNASLVNMLFIYLGEVKK